MRFGGCRWWGLGAGIDETPRIPRQTRHLHPDYRSLESMQGVLTLQIEREIMKAWEEMTHMERMRASYSDLHKEVYGMRPTNYAEISAWTDAELDREYVLLMDRLLEQPYEYRVSE